jgi:oxygen-independent coproporphyrinogen III oxidase
MAGIYIHIPFCKQACYYCNFHFSTSGKSQKAMILAIRRELSLRKYFIDSEEINTIYFGGGTPSLLDANEIGDIINDINRHFTVKSDAEITLEGNPDDLAEIKLNELRASGINRLSIGVQSFDDTTLELLNRAHNSGTAIQSITFAQKSGFDNLNIDLIFGIRPDYLPVLKSDLAIVESLGVQHISTYCLTIEEGTVFGSWSKKGKFQIVPEDDSAIQYEYVMDELTRMGYDHYEISNFALPGFESKHNSGYWINEKYLGIGPAAHSYNGVNRFYNISNNSLYIKSLSENKIPETVDYLSNNDRINEYIMTSIRTKWGCDLNLLNRKFGFNVSADMLSYIENLSNKGYMIKNDHFIQLTKKGKLIADKIASDMFIP